MSNHPPTVIRADYASSVSAYLANPAKDRAKATPYLHGFRVESHPDCGACIIGTDGVRIGAFHDRFGFVGEPETWVLSRRMMRHATQARHDETGKSRWIILERMGDKPDDTGFCKARASIVIGRNPSEVMDGAKPLLVDDAGVMDRSFQYPDWRKVIAGHKGSDDAIYLGGKELAAFIETARLNNDGARPANWGGHMSLNKSTDGSTTLIKTARSDFVGVLCEIPPHKADPNLKPVPPDWFGRKD